MTIPDLAAVILLSFRQRRPEAKILGSFCIFRIGSAVLCIIVAWLMHEIPLHGRTFVNHG